MPKFDSDIDTDSTLQAKCFSAMRIAKEIILQKGDPQGDLAVSVKDLEQVLFSAQLEKATVLIESYTNLIANLKEMENQVLHHETSLRPIGLQVATANSVSPIHLEWSYHNPDSIFLIEYAKFDDSILPDWRVYSKTRCTSYNIRGLQQGKSYWFRISALAPTI